MAAQPSVPNILIVQKSSRQSVPTNAGLEIIGAISAVAGLLESSISLFERLRRTYNDQKESSKILGAHVVEIQGILTILDLVKHEANLRTAAVLSEIESIRKIATELISNLELMMPGDKSQARRFAHQFLQGTKEQETLAKLMERLEHAKSSLGLGLHVAHVGVTRVVGDKVAINMEILNRVDGLLRNVFGDDGGLEIAEVVKNHRPEKDGLVHIKSEELSLRTSRDLKDAERGSGRIVLKNVTREQALQINGPIGEKGWREVSQLEIRDNEAAGSGIQVNHAVSEDVFLKLLTHKSQNKSDGTLGPILQISAGLMALLVFALALWLK
ncbi:hypothetical protein BcDW1_9815 [Botrytis cinerea BcDW1]|uniref:Uncharacterized protein n=2 Tax=Botryotinia fuckeliana TaxID=40559 RepID=G2YEL2_BOTF4|nr:hypothetical protein BcDW1_9815 [Botrytis cinerea BcDW1]CCD50210.1 hypothetical protein BofuT4_P091690.1 [Botrytis cinerea T4]